MKIRFAFALCSLAAVALVGCASHLSGNRATAKLEPTRGNTANGTVTFVQTGDGVQVSGEVRGLKPGAEHGFHVHEKGDCSSGDGMSTGGHFNPTAKPHGAHGAAEHHTGELPDHEYRRIFDEACGRYGTTRDYAQATYDELRKHGIHDRALARLIALAQQEA